MTQRPLSLPFFLGSHPPIPVSGRDAISLGAATMALIAGAAAFPDQLRSSARRLARTGRHLQLHRMHRGTWRLALLHCCVTHLLSLPLGEKTLPKSHSDWLYICAPCYISGKYSMPVPPFAAASPPQQPYYLLTLVISTFNITFTIGMGIRACPNGDKPERKRRRMNPVSKTFPVPHEVKLLDLPKDVLINVFAFLHHPDQRLNCRSLGGAGAAASLAATCHYLFSVAYSIYAPIVRTIDALSPADLDDLPIFPTAIPDQIAICSAAAMASTELRVVRLPRGLGAENVRQVLMTVANLCPNVTELVFEDDGAVDQDTVKALSSLKKLNKIEARVPSKDLLYMLGAGFPTVREVVLRKVPTARMEAVRTFLRTRGWKTNNWMSKGLTLFWIGIDMPQVMSWDCQTPEHVEQMGIMQDFIWYLEKCGKQDLPDLQSFKILDYVGHCFVKEFMLSLKRKRAQDRSFFCDTAEVEVVSKNELRTAGKNDQTTFIPSLTSPSRDCGSREISLQEILGSVRNDEVQSCITKTSRAHTIYISGPLFVSKYAQLDGPTRKRCIGIVETGGLDLERLQVSFGLSNHAHTSNLPKRAFQCMADILKAAKTITTVEVSSDIIEWTDESMEEFMQMLSACKNVTVLRLKSPRVLDKSRRTWCSERNARLVRRLPLFLKLLQAHVKKLDYLYLEMDDERSLRSSDGRAVLKSLQKGLTALRCFEEALPVDASTVRAQIKTWVKNVE